MNQPLIKDSLDGFTLQDYIDRKLIHTIHTSERRAFRSCRRRWNWSSLEMYYPKVQAQALEFGVAFHAAMEVFYEPSTWTKDLVYRQGMALIKFKTVCDEQLKKYITLNGEPEVTVLEDYKQRIKLGLNMIRYYTEFISKVTDVGFTPVEVEVEFEIPITSPEGKQLFCTCDRCWKKYFAWLQTSNTIDLNLDFVRTSGETATLKQLLVEGKHQKINWQGLPVTYGGRVDMLAQDELGRYWIYDWKTTARLLDEDSESSFLTLDDQIASYVWALRYLGMPVAGFVYVEIKKAYPTVPDELSRIIQGRRFSTSKQQMTSYDLYRQHVAEHDPLGYAEGAYDKFLYWLKTEGPRFHQRHQIHKNDHEVDNVALNIWLEAQDIIGNPRVYPQPGRFSCTSCLYRQPCIGMNQGEDFKYTLDSLFEKRTKHYYEEAKPSTE